MLQLEEENIFLLHLRLFRVFIFSAEFNLGNIPNPLQNWRLISPEK